MGNVLICHSDSHADALPHCPMGHACRTDRERERAVCMAPAGTVTRCAKVREAEATGSSSSVRGGATPATARLHGWCPAPASLPVLCSSPGRHPRRASLVVTAPTASSRRREEPLPGGGWGEAPGQISSNKRFYLDVCLNVVTHRVPQRAASGAARFAAAPAL